MAVTDAPTVEIPRAILEKLIEGARNPSSFETWAAADAAELILGRDPAPVQCDSTLKFAGYIHECSKLKGADHGDLHGTPRGLTWTDSQARKIEPKSEPTATYTCQDCGQKFESPQSYREGRGHQTSGVPTSGEPTLPVTLDQLKEWYESAQRKRKAAADSISTFVAFARFYEEHRAILEPVLKGMGPSKEVPLKHLKYWVDRLERGSSVQDLIGKFIKD